MNQPFFRSGNKPVVLITDDSVENLQILSELLKEDYRVKVAKNGPKALDILRSDNGIDLILLDIMMPEMDGFEVCETIKRDSAIAHIPVIFLTALNDATDETRAFRAGGADFITKPFNADVVKARIRTHLDLANERKFTQELLHIMLPENVIRELKTSGVYIPEKHSNTSVMFCDLDGFTAISSTMPPEDLIRELTEIFTRFDEIASQNQVMRIKTIGDAYMAVSGIGMNNPGPGALNMVNAGLQLIEYLEARNESAGLKWKCRVGIHTGEIISGLVGKSRFQYDVMGDHVNIASRVETNGIPMQVTVTAATAALLPDTGFRKESLGEVFLKGKGNMHLYTIRREG